MSYYEFGLLLYDNLYLYIAVFIFSVILYIVLFRRTVHSILDPYFFSLFFSCSGFSVVIFLFLINEISNFYFYQYLITQTFFFTGFLLTFRNEESNNKVAVNANNSTTINISNRYFIFYMCISTIFIVLQLYTYKVVGIPIFLKYRLAAVGIGGGFGIINRFVGLFSLISFYFTCLFLQTQHKRIAKIILVFIITFNILSGS